MKRRTFRLQSRLSEGTGSALLDVPHMATLRYRSPEQLLRWFEKTWGQPPEGVVLPVTSANGLLFAVEGVGLPLSPDASVSRSLADFQEVVQAFSSLGVHIYLLLDPTLHFCRTDALHIVDIVGDGSAAVCISNPRSQELLAALLGTAIDEVRITTERTPGKLKGVVLDVVDLWPMGASDGRLEVTCFCPSCEQYFEARKPDLVKKFRTFPNPWNLLLKDSGTGIAHIDEVRGNSKPEDIVGLARQKGFDDIFQDASDGTLLAHGKDLLDYIQIRHQETVDSIKEVFAQSLEGVDQEVTRVVLTEGTYYGWTSGLLLDLLDAPRQQSTDEVWFDPRSTGLFLRHLPFRSYMWRRSRYYVDAFLTFAGNVSDPVARATTGIARLSNEFAKDMLRSRLSQALGTALTDRSALASLPDLQGEASESKRQGFVGVALDAEVGEKFIQGLNIPEGIREAASEEDSSRLVDLLQGFMRPGKE